MTLLQSKRLVRLQSDENHFYTPKSPLLYPQNHFWTPKKHCWKKLSCPWCASSRKDTELNISFSGGKKVCEKQVICHDERLSFTKAQDYTGCLMKCQNFKSGCNFFTYHTENNFCELFTKCDDFNTTCENCLSGEVSCPVCERKGQCQNSTAIGVTFAKDITVCHKVW